jgi:hypothetical protein
MEGQECDPPFCTPLYEIDDMLTLTSCLILIFQGYPIGAMRFRWFGDPNLPRMHTPNWASSDRHNW